MTYGSQAHLGRAKSLILGLAAAAPRPFSKLAPGPPILVTSMPFLSQILEPRLRFTESILVIGPRDAHIEQVSPVIPSYTKLERYYSRNAFFTTQYCPHMRALDISQGSFENLSQIYSSSASVF